ncbi:MAG: chromosome partitioning protein [Candidatus Paceibacteria bacterium]|jgi:chromosome partitioning protein
MRRIAIINQKGGVGKTTTSVNLGAALAEQGRRVVICDLDPQANLSLHLGIEPAANDPSAYSVLHGATAFGDSLKETKEEHFRVLPSNIDLSGAELELASAIGRDTLLADAIDTWVKEHEEAHAEQPADYVIFDCPPSLGLLSINALAAAEEVLITVQTEFLALMGMSKLVDVVGLIQRRLNPSLKITGIAACLYDSRLRLAREVLGEIRKYFPGQVFANPVRSNVKLAEAPSFGQSIISYAPESNGALDYRKLALEVIAQESEHEDLAHLPKPRQIEALRAQKPEEPSVGGPFAGAVPPASTRPRIDRAPGPAHSKTAPAKKSRSLKLAQSIKTVPEEKEVTLTPQAPPQSDKASRPKDAVEEELQVMRSQDLPPLPPEAFQL